MAKSMLHAVVGTLVLDGRLSLDDRPPVAAWAEAGDPRAAITWDHLLQMRSGLQWVEEYYEFEGDALPDVVTMLYGDERADMAALRRRLPARPHAGFARGVQLLERHVEHRLRRGRHPHRGR